MSANVTAKAQIAAIVENVNTSFEDVLYAALEIAAYRERLPQYNPTNQNRINKSVGDTNNVSYTVSLATQTYPAIDNAGGFVTEVIDYLIEIPDAPLEGGTLG